jgi:hypothetical protein
MVIEKKNGSEQNHFKKGEKTKQILDLPHLPYRLGD